MQNNIKKAGWSELDTNGKVRPIFGAHQETRNYGSDSSTVHYTPPSKQASSGHSEDQDLLKAIAKSKIHIFGGTLFRFVGRSGAPKIGFAVEGLDENTVRTNTDYYEKMSNPFHGIAVFEGVIKIAPYHIYTFRVYDDALSVYEEVHAHGMQPGHPVVDCDKLMLELTRTIAWLCKNGTENYTPLKCISPNTVFIVRDGPQIRTVILPLRAAPNAPLPSEIPNDSAANVTTDIHSIAFLACEVWSGSFDCDGGKVSIPNTPIIRDMLSPIVGSRPSLKEFIQRLQEAESHPASGAKQRATAKVKEKHHSANSGSFFLRIWHSLCRVFARFKEWICNTGVGMDILQSQESSWRDPS